MRTFTVVVGIHTGRGKVSEVLFTVRSSNEAHATQAVRELIPETADVMYVNVEG